MPRETGKPRRTPRPGRDPMPKRRRQLLAALRAWYGGSERFEGNGYMERLMWLNLHPPVPPGARLGTESLRLRWEFEAQLARARAAPGEAAEPGRRPAKENSALPE